MFWGGTRFDDDLVMLLQHMSAEGLKGIALTLASRPDRLEEYAAHRADPRRQRERFEEKLGRMRESLSGIAPSVTAMPLIPVTTGRPSACPTAFEPTGRSTRRSSSRS